MKVKVGSEIYFGEIEPVMAILSDKDKENIKNMGTEDTKYCSFPDSMRGESCIDEFMNTDKPPKPPLNRFIRECDIGNSVDEMCPFCGSSFRRTWHIFKTNKCVNPECNNFWNR